MTIFFNEDEQQQPSELPWAKDFARCHPGVDTTANIHEIREGEKGLLVCTGRWKSFVFKDSKIYSKIKGALAYYMQTPPGHEALVARLYEDGKVSYGIDDSQRLSYWTAEKNVYTQKSIEDDGNGFGGEDDDPSTPPNPSPQKISARRVR